MLELGEGVGHRRMWHALSQRQPCILLHTPSVLITAAAVAFSVVAREEG